MTEENFSRDDVKKLFTIVLKQQGKAISKRTMCEGIGLVLASTVVGLAAACPELLPSAIRLCTLAVGSFLAGAAGISFAISHFGPKKIEQLENANQIIDEYLNQQKETLPS